MKLPPLLVVDDEKNMRLSLQTVLEGESYAVRLADSAEAGLKLIQQENFFMVITDARLGGMSGYEFLKTVAEKRPELPVIMITAYATPKLAVEAIKSGATDYLAKPFEPDELLHAVGRCAERHRLLTENAALKARAGNGIRIENIVGESAKMRELRQLIQTVAPTDATVLILGESGTGKELIAGAIHFHSHRASAPYIRLNCAAIPETLLESELFGYERGAFTGAHRTKRGYVEEADGGTIFLDEIGDMSRSLQAKLLRFLEDGSFTRVGGTQELRVQVRLIAATNRNIVEAIKKGEFREDLFHRLNVMQFRPPPLRERGSDIPLLARNFLKGFAAFAHDEHEVVGLGHPDGGRDRRVAVGFFGGPATHSGLQVSQNGRDWHVARIVAGENNLVCQRRRRTHGLAFFQRRASADSDHEKDATAGQGACLVEQFRQIGG
jgi:DNA-binding NtrC family response regulator